MANVLTISMGIVVTLLIGVIAEVTNARLVLPSAAVVFTVYASARRDMFGALLTALCLGILAGLPLGAARGVLLIALLGVVFATRPARRALPLSRRLPLVGWTVAAAMLFDFATVLVGAVLMPSLSIARALLTVSPRAALLTGVLALPCVLLLDWLDPLLRARQERGGLLA